MSVHRNRHGKWEVRYREGTRNGSKTFDRKRAADDFDAYQRDRRQRGGVVRRREDVPHLDAFAREWARDRAKSGLATGTVLYDARETYVRPEFGAEAG